MERPSRRSAAQHASNGHAPASNGSDSNARHRRRRETSSSNTMSASQSDGGAETDSSSVAAQDTGAGSSSVTRSSKKLLQRDAKKSHATQRGENPAAHDRRDGDEEEVDGDDEHEEEEDEHDLSSSESHATTSGGGGGDADSVGKRERSLSNVSTTSSSSSIASDHDEEDRLALQLEKLKELEKKKKMVEDGTLAEFCRRVTEFKEERNQLLETAEWHKSLQLKNSEDLYGFEVQRARDLWQQAKDSLKSEMLTHVDSLVVKLKQELDDLAKAEASHDAQATQTAVAVAATGEGSLSSDSTEAEDASSEKDEEQEAQEEKIKTKAPASSKRRKVVGIELPEQTVRLPLDDINSDLASILGDRKQRAEDSTARLNKKTIDNFKCERRRLFCGKYILEDGDEVVVSSPIIKEDYVGTISSVTEDAVYIKLSSGQKVRIYLELIEHKRCEVKPFLRGSAGMGSLQATGWVECEPF